MTSARRATAPRRTGCPPAAAWLLALALLLAQGVGLLHHTVHPGGSPSMDRHLATAVVVGQSETRHAAGWLDRLFGGTDHATVCQLYDHLAHADGLVRADLTWAPGTWVQALLAAPPMLLLAAQAAGFLARGPPRG